ncbi:MAG TPA: hypothetical protein VGA77_03115, partial [Propylenella sp.]
MPRFAILAALAVASTCLTTFAASPAIAAAEPDPPSVSVPEDAAPPTLLPLDQYEAPPMGRGPEDVPIVQYDAALLPMPVKRLREQIMEAAATGEPEALRAIFEAQGAPPELGPADAADPVEYIVSLSGDEEGREILAILIELFEAGYVHVDVGTTEEMYVWPYFARYPVEALTPPQLVELFKLVYAGD